MTWLFKKGMWHYYVIVVTEHYRFCTFKLVYFRSDVYDNGLLNWLPKKLRNIYERTIADKDFVRNGNISCIDFVVCSF